MYQKNLLILPALALGLAACVATPGAERTSVAGIKTESECLKAENPRKCEFEHLKAGGYPFDLRGGNGFRRGR